MNDDLIIQPLAADLSPGQLKLIEDVGQDAKEFYKKNKQEEVAQKTLKKEERKRSQRKTTKERVKEEEEAEQRNREQLEEEFNQLWTNLGDFDPYEGLDIERCDGKILVEEDDEVSGDTIDVKYRYFIKLHRAEENEANRKYFKAFDWKAKGVIRKRFEVVIRPRFLRKGKKLAEFKKRLTDLKYSIKDLEKVIGRQDEMRNIFNDQQTRYNFFAKPYNYYKEFFQIQNPRDLSFEQLDIRRLPPYYAHRKLSESLAEITRYVSNQKERKYRTTLSDHTLFAVLTDAHKFTKAKVIKEVEGDEDHQDLEEAEEVAEEQIDWGQVRNLAEVIDDQDEEINNEEVENVDGPKGDKKKKRKKVYNKEQPFADKQALLVHRYLHEQNLEYVFFVKESGSKEIGVFLILIEALTYKKQEL